MRTRTLNLFLIGSFGLFVIFSGCKKNDLSTEENTTNTGIAPVSDFNVNKLAGFVNDSITFSDQSTNNPSSWLWNFGDGQTSTQKNPSHIYNTVGTYTISLIVTNSYGSDTATKINYIDISDTIAPVADFISDNTTISEGGTILFTDQSTNNPNSWLWNFGDGQISMQENPSHTYNTAGIYTITLIAANTYGSDTATKINYISVNGQGAGLTDIDGNNYTSIIINGQEWMAENLKVTKYPNGDPIPLITDNTSWGNLSDNNTDDAYCFYNNDNNTDYGALYTYAAAIGDNWTKDNIENQGVCPDGWHIPNDTEWTALINNLGGENIAGGKMKEIGTTHWNSPNTGADNSSGFSALPGGLRYFSDGSFGNISKYGYWWSSTETLNSNFSYNRGLNYDNANANQGNGGKSSGFSVRCIKD